MKFVCLGPVPLMLFCSASNQCPPRLSSSPQLGSKPNPSTPSEDALDGVTTKQAILMPIQYSMVFDGPPSMPVFLNLGRCVGKPQLPEFPSQPGEFWELVHTSLSCQGWETFLYALPSMAFCKRLRKNSKGWLFFFLGKDT